MSAILRRNNGFTLLEVLIAVVLLGILSTALYGSYFAVLQARDRSAEGMEARRELGSTLDLLRREIDSAKYDSGDKSKHLRFVVEDRDIFGKPASTLELTTLAPPANQARSESGIINVQYRLQEKDKQLILTRREQDILLEVEKVPVYPQMERISSFLVECYDGSKWLKTWDTALNNGLPKQVRITVQFEENGHLVDFSVYSQPRLVIGS
ncbi:MAG TPA: GspJ family type II secretion system protein [Desulfuromonadaceae bacterium]